MTVESVAPVVSGANPSLALRTGFVLVPLVHSAGMNLVTLLAFRFLTDNLAVSAALAGALFAFVKIYDGLLDPALGSWSDRTQTRWGRRLPYLLAGALAMPLSLLFIFAPPQLPSQAATLGVLLLALMLHASAYTALTVPGMAMVAEGSDDYHTRSVLMSWRVLGNSIGVLFGSTLPAWLLARWGATLEGHARMAYVIAAILLVAGVLAVLLLREAPRTAPTRREALAFAARFRLAWDNRPFRTLAITHIFILMGTAVTSLGIAYFSRYVLRLGDAWLGTYFMFAIAGTLVSMPMWLAFSRRYGKKRGYLISMGGFGLVHLSWLLVGAGEPYGWVVARAIFAGLVSGGLILFAYSMLSDAMRYDFVTTGLRREGAFAGITSLIDKLAAAGAIAVAGVFMSAMGYVSSRAGAAAQQPASAIDAIYILFAVVPAVAMLCGAIALRSYQLDEQSMPREHTA